jgi:hypothetical protein
MSFLPGVASGYVDYDDWLTNAGTRLMQLADFNHNLALLIRNGELL